MTRALPDIVPCNWAHRGCLGLLMLGLACAASAEEGLQTGVTETPVTAETVERGRSFNILDTASFVAFPYPMSNPTIGSGLGAMTAAFYQMDEKSQPSYTGLGGFYTSTKSWAAGISQSLSFDGDRYRIDIPLGFAELNYDFFGVGFAAGDAGLSIPITQRGYIFRPQAMARVADGFYAGVFYRLLKISTSFDIDAPNRAAVATLLGQETHITSSGPGLIAVYDTRDNRFTPKSGELINGEIVFASAAFLGTSTYRRAFATYNRFDKLTERTVLASRASGCYVSGETPTFDLCLFGSSNDLRGYPAGRYRDKTMLAAQSEIRWQAFERVGFVAFGGIGEVGRELGDYSFDRMLASAGVGVRLLASRDYGVNLSIDVAVTRDGETGVYFRIGEAF